MRLISFSIGLGYSHWSPSFFLLKIYSNFKIFKLEDFTNNNINILFK